MKQVDLDEIKRMSWYLYADIPCHRLMISTLNGHIQVASLDGVNIYLWSRSYIVYDSCWWLSWSCLDIWSLL